MPKFSQAGKDKKALKAFALIQSKIKIAKTKRWVQKLLKKQQRKEKKKSRRSRYESSNLDSDLS
jgi:hypothetical protein